MRNFPEWMLAFCAITSVGGIAVAMNSMWTAEEMEYGLRDSGAVVLFADRERIDLLRHCDAIDGLRVVAVRTEAPEGAVDLAARLVAIGDVPMPDRAARPRRPRHHPLHVGLHGPSQGCRVHPPQHRVGDPDVGARRAGRRQCARRRRHSRRTHRNDAGHDAARPCRCST